MTFFCDLASSRCLSNVRSLRTYGAAALLCALATLAAIASAAAAAAEPTKTLRLSFKMGETSFDNAFASDAVSQSIGERILEPMLEYDYFCLLYTSRCV